MRKRRWGSEVEYLEYPTRCISLREREEVLPHGDGGRGLVSVHPNGRHLTRPRR